MTANRLWILGASDPEMAAIETLVRGCGEQVAYAACASPAVVRVGPGNASRAPHLITTGDWPLSPTPVEPESESASFSSSAVGRRPTPSRARYRNKAVDRARFYGAPILTRRFSRRFRTRFVERTRRFPSLGETAAS